MCILLSHLRSWRAAVAGLFFMVLGHGLSAQALGTVVGQARAETGTVTAASDDFDPASTDFTVEDNFTGETDHTFNPTQLGASARADLYGSNYFEVRGNAGATAPNGSQVHAGSADAYSKVVGFDELFFKRADDNPITSSFSLTLLADFGSSPHVYPESFRTSPVAYLSMDVYISVYDETLARIFYAALSYDHSLSYHEYTGEATVTQHGDLQQTSTFSVNPGDRVILEYNLIGEARSGVYDNQDILIGTDPSEYLGYSSGASYFGRLFLGIDDITSSEGVLFDDSLTGIDYSAANVPEPSLTVLGMSLLGLLWLGLRRRRA